MSVGTMMFDKTFHNLTVISGLSIAGAMNLNSTLSVDDTVVLGSRLSVASNVVAASTLSVANTVVLASRLSVASDVVLAGVLSAGGNVLLAGTLSAAGNVLLGNATTDTVGFYGSAGVARANAITTPAGGVTQDAEARTAISSILTVLRNLNLIAT